MLQLVEAQGAILEEILRGTHPIWHDQMSWDAYVRFWNAQLKTPWGRTHLRRVALVDGPRVLASLKIYHFDAVLDGRPVGVCGLGAVFTQPEYRGQGHARVLIERVLENATAMGQQWALLFSEIGIDYYARIGFIGVPAHDATFVVAAPPPNRGAPATLVRAGDDRDLDAIVALGRTRAEPYRFHFDRDRGLVQYTLAKQRLRAGLAPSGTRSLEFFVAEEGASAVAYVMLAVEGGTWTLLECGDRDPTGARIGAMLQVLIAREPGQPAPTIVGRLPAGLLPPQVTVTGRHVPLAPDGTGSTEHMMIRPLGDGIVAPPLGEADVLYWRSDLF